MALSDELLKAPNKLAALRDRLALEREEAGARAAFLLDESGSPFATVGTIEFSLPDPVSSHTELLSALLGETVPSSPYLVARAAKRALVVLVFDSPAAANENRTRMAPLANAIESLLEREQRDGES